MAQRQTVGQMGEFALISAITQRLGPSSIEVGPGDDAAVFAAPDGRVVATTDVLVEGVHFRLDWSSAEDIGHKSVAQNLADVCAMGARPTSLLVGLGLPAECEVDWVLQLADGMRDEAALVGAAIVGGDIVRSERVIISISAFGDLAGRKPVRRSGARPGDFVAVCGRLGHAAAGLHMLRSGFRSPRELIAAHRRPEPPYANAIEVAEVAHAMIDVSDGLAADLGHLAQASGVDIELDLSAIEIPEVMTAAASAFNADPMQWVLTGGEDHAFAAAFAEIPPGWTLVGRVVPGSGNVHWRGETITAGGWDHFTANS